MIHVIASIYIKDGKLADMQNIYKTFVPEVLGEKGCVMYSPTVDQPTDVAIQVTESEVITIIEKWEDMNSLKAHLSAPHVIQFREDAKDIIEKVSIKILKDL